VNQLARLTLARTATSAEQEQLSAAVQSGVLGWPEVAQVLLLSNEFAFVD
jgi:hypothetical protein